MRRLGVVTMAAALVSLCLGGAAAPASPRSPSWSVVPSPNPIARAGATGGASLNGVACPTRTSCVVVGDYVDGEARPLVGHSTGTSWSIGPAPEPPSTKNPRGQLSAVACQTPTRCFGVGYFNNGASTRALIEQWNGSAWSIVTNPKMPGSWRSSLAGVACPTSASCFAVGYVNELSAPSKTLVVHWNGAAWSVIKSANPPGGGQLSGISCVASASCVAVGSANGSVRKTLVERWDATKWSVVKSPSPPHSTMSVLSAVSCATKSSCFAVGYYLGSPAAWPTALAERSNGDTWSIVATPDEPSVSDGEGSGLGGITCLSATACFAVGNAISNYASAPRVERWNGKSWSAVPIADLNPYTSEGLTSITCASVTSCVAVGSSFYGTLIEQWNGTRWSEVPAGGSASRMSSISCPSTTMCFAVGSSAPGFRYFVDKKALIEQWNGTSWKLVASPDPSPGTDDFAQLTSVSCPTTTSCFAVGLFGPNNDLEMLIERWDGTRWSLVTVPNPPDMTNVELTSVSCTLPTLCFAVGDGPTSNGRSTFVERWDGATWSTELLPGPPGGAAGGPAGISCFATLTCLAVGSYVNGAASNTLVERWNRTAWSIEPSPSDTDATFSGLASASCPSVDRCVAVGFHYDADNSTGETLIEQWDGAAWSIVPSPNPTGAYYSRLAGVSCLTSTNCFAVGAAYMVDGNQVALVEHWDGASWSLVPIANPSGALRSELSGISCVAGSCFAVGMYETAVSRLTLVERYS